MNEGEEEQLGHTSSYFQNTDSCLQIETQTGRVDVAGEGEMSSFGNEMMRDLENKAVGAGSENS